HSDRGHAEAEEAGVGTLEIGAQRAVVEEVLDEPLGQPRAPDAAAPAADRDDALDAGIVEALEEGAGADHSGRAEENHLHGRRLRRRASRAAPGRPRP